MSEETEIFFPDAGSLPFPFTVRSLLTKAGSTVERGAKLLSYSFVYRPTEAGSNPETRFGSWEATFEGDLRSWNVKPGDIISRERAKSRPALRIVEPCKHGVQFNGLCALCGIDMTSFDYTGRAESSKATIQMTHSASGPTVSLDEARRLEQETAEHLLKSRKLSLIVDLDQTIVHATVDPTVGDWIAEGEAWEERHARNKERRARAAAKKEEHNSDESDESSDSEEEEEEEVNPNWEALKDVKKFRLPPDNFGAPRPRWPNQPPDKGVANDGCLYYVKPRPGWKDFLSSVATKYELHVYTMGTRAYAEKVCAAIDPDGTVFGGRILSRDESGSLTQKSLRRLFPVDTSMVVIIDDRADVWEWSPNLLKVIPYDFFVGIGDINSAFLPKVDAMGAGTLAPPQSVAEKGSESSSAGNSSENPISVPSSAPPTSGGSEEDSADAPDDELEENVGKSAKSEMITQNALALEAQVEERPLAKKQEQLESDEEAEGQRSQTPSESNGSPSENGNAPEQGEQAKVKPHRKALLKNDDDELLRIGELLDKVHERFFYAYDNRIPQNSTSKRRKSIAQREVPYDVKHIIPSLRRETFRDLHLVFSGVIPTNMRVDHETTEIWKMARAFGATCHKDLVKDVTHVVTSKRGTQKVERARLMPNVHVVWIQWFSDSIAQWRRQTETRYLLDEEPAPPDAVASSPPSDPNAVSSDTDPEALVGDGDDEDMEDVLELDEGQAPIVNGSKPASAQGSVIPEGELDLNEVDWQNVNDEVDAAMMESDSEDEDGGRGSTRSSVISEDESMMEDDASVASLPQTRRDRKRLRSVTPSESGSAPDVLRSPLSKRKKVAAERSGMSKLKMAMSATEIGGEAGGAESEAGDESNPSSPVYENGSHESQGSYEEESSLDEGDGDEIDDDFLAKEMEEELG